MATINSNEIWGFLQLHNGKPLHVEGWQRYANPDLRHGRRSPVSTSGRSYTHRSRYTAPSTVCTSASSVFSQSRAGTVTSVETAPSRNGAHMSFEQQFAQPSLLGSDSELWCEFHELMRCRATFRADEEAHWIQHHIHHMDGQFPRELVCWFCDDPISFVAEHPADDYTIFEERMQHIRDHILDRNQTPESMRPDFHMIQHLFNVGRIDKTTRNIALSYSELPWYLRHPDATPDLSVGQGPLGRAQPEVYIHNLEKENRDRRRQEGRSARR